VAKTFCGFAGVPLLPFAGVFGGLALLVFGQRALKFAVILAAGWFAGLAGLVAFYSHFTTWKAFTDFILPFTVIGSSGAAGTSKLSVKIFGEYPGADSLFTCFFGNPIEVNDLKVMFEHSAAILFAVFVWTAWRLWARFTRPQRQMVTFIVLLTLLLPPVMHIAGHYRAMYRWMTFIPLCVAVPCLLQNFFASEIAVGARRVMLAAFALSLLMGIPAHTVQVLADWRARSPTDMEAVVKPEVKPSDGVVCTRRAYFTVRPLARLVYCEDMVARGAFPLTPNFPRDEITLLLLPPGDFAVVTNLTGANWEKQMPRASAEIVAAMNRTRFAVEIWRRPTATNSF